MQCSMAKDLVVVRIHLLQHKGVNMDINQIVNIAGGFLMGVFAKWLQEAHKRDKIRQQNKNGKIK